MYQVADLVSDPFDLNRNKRMTDQSSSFLYMVAPGGW